MEVNNIFKAPLVEISKKVASLKSSIDLKVTKLSNAFFKNITTVKVKDGELSQPLILNPSLKGKLLKLFIKLVYGESYIKTFKKVAVDKLKDEYPYVQHKILEESSKREKSAPQGALRFQNGLPSGYLQESKKQISEYTKMPHADLGAVHCQALEKQSQNAEKSRGYLEDMASGDGHNWTALRVINKNGRPFVVEGQICPTSERAARISDDLNNIYIHLSDKGHLTITCGVIDTPDKAEQFMAAIAHALIKYKDSVITEKPLRINMHQLNSMGSGLGVLVSEHALVTKQHVMSRYINQNLPNVLGQQGIKVSGNSPYVTHVNRCLNGFTHVKGESERAHSTNREGIATQMSWLMDDLGPDFSINNVVNDTLNKLNATQSRLDKLEEIINSYKPSAFKAKIQYVEAEITRVNIALNDLSTDNKIELAKLLERRESIRDDALELVNTGKLDRHDFEAWIKGETTLIDLNKKYPRLGEEGEEEVPSLLEQLQTKAIASTAKEIDQLNLDRNVERDMQHAGLYENEKEYLSAIKEEYASCQAKIKVLEGELDEELQNLAVEMSSIEDIENPETATTIKIAASLLAIHTGLAGKPGFPPKLSPTQELSYQLLLDHTLNAVSEINCRSGLDRTGFARSLHNVMQQMLKEKPLKEVFDFLTTFEDKVKEMDGQDSTEGYKEVMEFQEKVFAELMGVAIPITGRSAGVEGLKWHHDKKSLNPYEKNPHPLPYLPRSIKNSDGVTTTTLITIDPNGKRSLSQSANALLMRLSAARGG